MSDTSDAILNNSLTCARVRAYRYFAEVPSLPSLASPWETEEGPVSTNFPSQLTSFLPVASGQVGETWCLEQRGIVSAWEGRADWAKKARSYG